VTRSRQILFLGTGILLLLVSLGCGNGSNFEADVAPTASPLVAKYTLVIPPQGAVAWVEFGADLNYGRQTSMTAATTSPEQTVNIIVAGMKASTTYHMRSHVTWAGDQSWVSADQTFTTGKLPALPGNLTLPKITVTRPTPSLTPSSGVEMFNLVTPGNMLLSAFVTDLEGNVIWYYYPDTPGLSTVPMRMMPNGNFLIHLNDLMEVDLAGNVLRDVSVAQVNKSLQAKGYDFQINPSFHHDVIVLPNGHWVTLANSEKLFTNLVGYPGVTNVLGDDLIDIDLNGNVAWAWSGFENGLKTGLDINRHLQTQSLVPGTLDWTHSNAIVYTADHNLLLSMRHQSWILKIDYADGTGTGDILWKLGDDGDFAITGGDTKDWFYAQHFPHLESTNADGSQMTLAVFDNGNLRLANNGQDCTQTFSPTSSASATCFSRATLFDVNETSMVATLNWQYPTGFYSWWGGSVGTLTNGDVEFDMATVSTVATPASQVMEVTSDDAAKTVWQLNVTGANAYRAYRIPSLYPGVTWKD
jgi:arylsulfate sulfotransferase